jgi:hypothetical protein
MTTPTIRIWYAIVVAMTACVAVALAGVSYTNHVQQVANQRWCTLFAILNPASAPPTTERGQKVAEEIARMRRDFDCPP